MNDIKQKLDEFFDQYASRMNKSVADMPVIDVEATAGAFADFFVESSPVGVSGGANDDKFRAMILKGAEHYRSIGTRSMTTAKREFTKLDDGHWMAKIHWHSRYQKKDGKQTVIDFDVIYFLNVTDGTPKIFAYVTGDEEKVMKENGLIDEPQEMATA